MAGDWIPWTKGLTKKLEVLAIAERTNRTPREVAAILMEFWEWADSETHAEPDKKSRDALLKHITIRSISASHAEMDRKFIDAMAEVGWILFRPDGAIVIPNFGRWMGRSAKRRLKDKERKQDTLSIQPKPSEDGDDGREISASHADEKRTTEQNRTEQKEEDPLPPVPGELDTEEFRKAWEDWQRHRVSIRKRMKPDGARLILAKCIKIGVERAVKAITHSIANGYQGLYEEADEKHGARTTGHGASVGQATRIRHDNSKLDAIPLFSPLETEPGTKKTTPAATSTTPQPDSAVPAEGNP